MVFFNLFLNTNLMGLLIANAIQKSEASKDSFFKRAFAFCYNGGIIVSAYKRKTHNATKNKTVVNVAWDEPFKARLSRNISLLCHNCPRALIATYWGLSSLDSDFN